MKLFFKHLIRSIRKKPTQPLIIVLTLALSVAMIIFALTIRDSLMRDTEMSQAAKYGSADFTVETGNSSDSRFLFASDIRAALGDRAKVAGSYPLPLIFGDMGDTVNGMATELSRLDGVFSVEWIAYGRVTNATLSELAFVSLDFAEQRGVSLGDTILVETMGHQKAYRVEGISNRPFLDRYDIMVDIGSVMRIFAEQSMLFAAIGEEFKPCHTVYIDLTDASLSPEEAISHLKADARFADMRFTDVREAESARGYMEYLEVVISVSVALTMLLACVVSFCCFFILANQREQENFSLACCGASPRFLAAMQYAEVTVYFLIGAPIGVLVAIPSVQMISLFVGLSYAEVSVLPLTALKSVGMLFTVCMATVALFLVFAKRLSRKGEKRHRLGMRKGFFLMGVMAVLLVVLFAVPSKFSFSVYCMQITVIVLFLFVAVPPLLQRFAGLCDRLLVRTRSNVGLSLRYAVKNTASLKMLHNISMLCALATLTALTIGFLLVTFDMKVDGFSRIVRADYVVHNATDRCYEKIQSCEGAEEINQFYMNTVDSMLVISMQNASACSPTMDIKQLPSGNQAVLSEGIARRLDVRVGETLNLELDGAQYTFTVSDIAQTGIGFIVINCEAIGIPYNSILVKGEEGVSRAALLSALSEATATELAPIQSANTLFAYISDAVETFMRAGAILFSVLGVFFVIGMLDALYECMRARREDFGLYYLAGFSKRQLLLMRVWEIVIPIVFGIVIGILVSVISLISLNRGVAKFGIIPFRDFLEFRDFS